MPITDREIFEHEEFIKKLRGSKQAVRLEAADRMQEILDELLEVRRAQAVLMPMPYDSEDFHDAVVAVVKESLSLETVEEEHYTGGMDGRNLYEKSLKLTLTADGDEISSHEL